MNINISKKEIKRNILISIPVLFLVGFPLHFLYDLTGKLNIIAFFAPVNESIWEHTKLATVPALIWWIISYSILKKKVDINLTKWVFSTSIAIVSMPVIIVSFYYTYTGALGISYLMLDISSLLFALIVGQSLALHIYNNIITKKIWKHIGIIIIMLLVIFTTIFTFNTPHLPIFKDGPTGAYGILKR